MFERHSFVAVTSRDLARSREFWVDIFGCAAVEERPGEFLTVDVGGLRLRLRAEDGREHVVAGLDPSLALKVASVQDAIDALNEAGLEQYPSIQRGEQGAYAILRDPEGRAVILTEAA
jgi:catechol 2,3-dioxygenase-like lactoylglutathione lyase family enzyme